MTAAARNQPTFRKSQRHMDEGRENRRKKRGTKDDEFSMKGARGIVKAICRDWFPRAKFRRYNADILRGQFPVRGPEWGRFPIMSTTDSIDLSRRKCVPCEGGIPKLTRAEARSLMAKLPGW